MAITKIHPITTTIGASINYIINEKKTYDIHGSEEQLVTCLGTSKFTAEFDFLGDLKHTRQSEKKNHLAYHIIQSFSPTDELTFEEAHKIGNEFCEEYLKGKYRAVIATHIDKGHIHNHIIFCAADSFEHKKMHDDKKNYYKVRNISDKLCKEHHISIIQEPSPERGKSKYEYEQIKKGNSWKDALKKDMQNAIKKAKSYEQFLDNMEELGYEYKGEAIGENAPKYLSFRSMEQNDDGEYKTKFIRVTEKNFGKGFTKEKIKDRIDDKVAWIEKNKQKPKDYATSKIIDKSDAKFENKGLERWATSENLKIYQAMLNKYGSRTALENKMELCKYEIEEDNAAIKQNNVEIKRLQELIRLMDTYDETERINYHYSKSVNPDKYMREHEGDLLRYSYAYQELRKLKINPKEIDIKLLKEELNELQLDNNDLNKNIKEAKQELREYERDLERIKQYENVSKASHDIHSIIENNRKKKNENVNINDD